MIESSRSANMRSTIQRAVTLCRWFAVLAIAVSCFAQVPQTATITGTVTAYGAVVPKATVSIRNDRVSYLTVKSDNEGHFVIEAPPGTYTLRASTEAYGAPEQTVTLTSGTSTVVKISLLLTSCDVCYSPQPIQLEIPGESVDLLHPLNPLTPYKFPIRAAKRRHT